MKYILAIAILFLQLHLVANQPEKKPQTIVMTDGEVDDHNSMIRFLLYTCDLNLKPKGEKAELQMPRLEENAAVHIILKVTDNGSPELTGYKRIILMNGK